MPFWEGLGVGGLIGLLLVSKVNCLTAALAILVVGGLLVRHGRTFWRGCAVSLSLGLAVYLVYMHGNAIAYARGLVYPREEATQRRTS